MSNISDWYESNIWQEAGDTGANRANMAPQFQRGLLHLVHHIFYTKVGRQFMHDERPLPGGLKTEAQVRTAFIEKCELFGVRGPAQQAIIDGHIAGWRWVDAHEAQKFDERAVHEATFKHQMAAVSWHLWEEGTGPLFPLAW